MRWKDLHRMPAAFIGHGSPMNAIELKDFTRSWQALGQALPRPRAVLAISAHWFIHGTAVTAMARPRVMHDFYGFPAALFAVDYPARGSPEVAHEIADAMGPRKCQPRSRQLGARPRHLVGADAPLSERRCSDAAVVDPRRPPLAYHLDLGARLAPLRERGVLVLGSGNVVHNLRQIDWSYGDRGFDWADRFDAHVRDLMTSDPAALEQVQRHRDHALAVPTAEHSLPLAYIAALCAASGEAARPCAEGRTRGSLSMTSYLVAWRCHGPCAG